MTISLTRNVSQLALAAALAGVTVPARATDPSAAQTTPAKTPACDADVLLDFFQKKGLISSQDVKDAEAALASRTNNAPPDVFGSKWKVANTFESVQLYGDVRFRYEYRGVNNAPGATPDTYYRERFRYAVRAGLRGDIKDDFNFGIRLETSSNPRSPWDTFGNNTTAGSVTPGDKNAASVYLEQVYLGWHPAKWFEMTVGRMAMPLYTTPMVWDSDINPEGAFEKFKYSFKQADLFADFAQFDYQDPSSAAEVPSSDTFILAWQLGAQVNINKDMYFKVAPVYYLYNGVGSSGNGLNLPFVGQGNAAGANVGVPGASAANLAGYNQNGINNLEILEIPAEYAYTFQADGLGPMQVRAFGDFAYNFSGADRANAAFKANPAAFPGANGPLSGQDKAYQVGLGIGSAGIKYGPAQGLVYGTTAQKHAWEARAYWQRVEQYALDVNLLDSDFFEGRGNLQGVYSALSYGFTDAIIGTLRYGHAYRINGNVGTGGNNLDIPGLNPINYYNLYQLDLTWRF